MRPTRSSTVVFAKFVVINVLNTGLYWLLYLLFLQFMPYLWANTAALVLAVLAAYVANARFAFDVPTSRRSLVRYLIANGTTIVARTGVAFVLVDLLRVREGLVPPIAVAITTPLAFVLTRWALGPPRTAAPAPRPVG
ncbi:Putative flippase GtrA (transmembrane translocase of bactoprenol-linked glucose) [Klenkia taihuensis]|uniref:Putative flippase GtrA (Transmembrane translocase of bactoprenol-linked glucose) n=1 Tax=Klenkia taihuensis TaxID=1225127 RepID=A0A1I1JXE6_9ACTN|nr:Putative flippase GtrA (transmembrane translocase of bactoprenol-linked glucose) [Klenkia taihuensis]